MLVATDFGKVIRNRRIALRITQPHLADLAGISINSLYKIERGQANPTVVLINKIAEVLGMELILQTKKTLQ